jgi:thiamine biosynthesis lipoprotein
LRRTAFLVLALGLAAPGRAAEPVVVSDGRYVMGTILEITLAAPDAPRGRALLDRLYGTAAALDALLSHWQPESGLSRFNRAAGQGPQRIDPDLARALALSLELSRETGGAFDVTVGPLVALWRHAGERGVAPTGEERARARARSGAAGLRVDLAASTAELERTGAAVDLGGLAKGLALDRLHEELERAGIESALLSFGQSSLLAIGAPPGAPGWRLLVRQPDPGGEGQGAAGFAGVATLRDRAASISATLGQWTEIEGRRYGHLIDPRSGEPLQRAAQAMVLSASAARAEAWSKALLVLEPREALERLAAAGGEALVLEADGRSFETPGWRAATAFEAIAHGASESSETSSPPSKPASR